MTTKLALKVELKGAMKDMTDKYRHNIETSNMHTATVHAGTTCMHHQHKSVESGEVTTLC